MVFFLSCLDFTGQLFIFVYLIWLRRHKQIKTNVREIRENFIKLKNVVADLCRWALDVRCGWFSSHRFRHHRPRWQHLGAGRRLPSGRYLFVNLLGILCVFVFLVSILFVIRFICDQCNWVDWECDPCNIG